MKILEEDEMKIRTRVTKYEPDMSFKTEQPLTLKVELRGLDVNSPILKLGF